MPPRVSFEFVNSAFNCRLSTFSVVNHEHIDLKEFFADAFHHFDFHLYRTLEDHSIVKFSSCLDATFEKTVQSSDGEWHQENQTIYVHTRNEIIDIDTNLAEFFEEYIVDYILRKVDDIMLVG